ncbi:MAG: diaminopimelate decarboxylase [Candidatus Acidiferrales bacterium]
MTIQEPANYTPCFSIRKRGRGDSHIYCEGVSLEAIAGKTGTPSYVYSRASIEQAYRRLDRAFGALPHTLCYAMKANSNLSVLRVLARLGSSFDIVSGGELDRLGRLGISRRRIVFSGVGKSREEIREALRYRGARDQKGGIFLFNVESAEEMQTLAEEAQRHVSRGGVRPGVSMRVNPDVLAGGHRHIATGARQHKFGVAWEEARKIYLQHRDSRAIAWRGISAHIGSQIVTVEPFRRALKRLASWVGELGHQGIHLDCIDIGGGLGIRYQDETAIDPAEYARTLSRIVKPLGCRLLFEPGRAIVGPAGVLLTRVRYVKETRGKRFVIVDAAMNDLIRPALYDGRHPITKYRRSSPPARRPSAADIVGPVCETGDFLARDIPFEDVRAGDLLVVWAAGAYGFVESSNYNARPRAAEILVEGSRFRVARRRETHADMMRGEI